MKSASFFLFSVLIHSAVVIAFPFSRAMAPVERSIPVTILSYGQPGGGSGSSAPEDKPNFPAKSLKTSTPKIPSGRNKTVKPATPRAKKQQSPILPAPMPAKKSVASIAVVAEKSISRFSASESEDEDQFAADPVTTGGEQGGAVAVSRLDSMAGGTGSESGLGSNQRGSGSGNTEGPGAGAMVAQLTPVGFSHAPPPHYPASARADGKEGRVLLRVLVDEEGKSQIVEINDSSGSRVLDRAAAEAVKRWRFLPARYGRTAMASWVKVPVDFRLTETKK